MLLKILAIFCASTLAICWAYQIPNVKLENLKEGGFRVSIPNEPGVKYVAFNVNRNRPFKAFEPGEYSTQIREPTNDRWSYEIKRSLEDGDILYVWLSVQHEQSIYRLASTQLSASGSLATGSDNTNVTPKTPPETTNSADECAPSITVIENRRVCKGQLIFEDNFDNELNVSIWKQEVRLPLDAGDAEFVLYDTNADVAEGLLVVEPKLWMADRAGANIRQGQINLGARCTGTQNRAMECQRHAQGLVQNVLPPVISARINTKESFHFQYGRVDIRAKLPKGDWLLPLMLLEPLTQHYGQSAYTSGQLRVANVRGNLELIAQNGDVIDGRTLYGGAILSTNALLRHRSMVKLHKNQHFGNDFHIYTLIWDDQRLTLQVDGETYGEIAGDFADTYTTHEISSYAWKTGGYMAPFDKQFYITLGVSAGGHADFPDEISTPNKPWINTSPKAAFMFWRDRANWKQTWSQPSLQVDYVRVYAI